MTPCSKDCTNFIRSSKMSLTKLIHILNLKIIDIEEYFSTVDQIKNVFLNTPWKLRELDLEAISKLLRLLLLYPSDSKSVDSIVKHGINLSSLQVALLLGNVQQLKWSFKNGEQFNGPEWYTDSLIKCLYYKTDYEVLKDVLRFLLGEGHLDYEFENSKGENLLFTFIRYFAARIDNHDAAEIAKILIESGIPIKNEDGSSWAPLFYCIQLENLPLVSLLIDKGVDIKNNQCVSKAAETNNIFVLDLLLSSGADINYKTFNGSTALHRACKLSKLQSIGFLMQKGADFNAENNDGKTPFELVRSHCYNYDECIEIVVKFISKLNFENFPVSEKNMNLIQSNSKARKHFDMCISELNQLKNAVFYAPYSYYFVLKTSKKGMKKLSNLTKNEEFVEKFQENLGRFSCYKDELQNIFEGAIKLRNESIIIASRLYSIFGKLLPDTVIEKLTENLTVKDVPLQ